MSVTLTQENFAHVMGQFYDLIMKKGVVIDYSIRDEEDMSAYDYVVSGKFRDSSENVAMTNSKEEMRAYLNSIK